VEIATAQKRLGTATATVAALRQFRS